MDWFDDAKGWKSQQGGLSAIKQATTDENNMGGFFVRKMAGAVGLAVQLQKLLPLLAHPTGAQWSLGHFRPLLYTAIITNFMNAAFFGIYLNDLKQAGAEKLVLAAIGLLILEAAAIGHYIFWSKTRRGTAIAMTEGKTPTSVASRIVSRTVALVTSVIGLIVIRDLCFPGYILELLPRDDIYLEWTNAFLHSPPEGSPEALEHGLEAPLYIGDKFIGQLMALNIVICCVYKLVSAFAIRYGSDGGGLIKAKILWKGMFFADGLMLLVFRLFVSAALTASLDLRWHVMALSYETFILGEFKIRQSCFWCLLLDANNISFSRGIRLLLGRGFESTVGYKPFTWSQVTTP